jgi:hypothetical protein
VKKAVLIMKIGKESARIRYHQSESTRKIPEDYGLKRMLSGWKQMVAVLTWRMLSMKMCSFI